MTKSELIERLASQQSHIPAKAVEDAVKKCWNIWPQRLLKVSALKSAVSAAFLCTIEHLAPDVTRKLVIKSNWKVSTFRTLSPGKNYVTAPIFMKGELHDVQPA